jgi:hypothetical protein
MADTKHTYAAPVSTGPTEGDGVNYRGIVWFIVVTGLTTAVCQLLMWWLVRIEHARVAAADTPRAPHAVGVMTNPPPPNLLTLDSVTMPLGEPTNLQRFRESEDAVLTTYGWVDKNANTVRIPIERAKALLLERGLPVRAATGK